MELLEQEKEHFDSKDLSKEERVNLFLGSMPEMQFLFNPYPVMAGIGDRMIGLGPNTVVFGVVVMETPEELIVCHPTTLVRDDSGDVTGKLMVGTPLMKMYKSSVMSVSEPDRQHRSYYYSFLLSLGKSLYPPLFNEQRLDSMRSFVGKYESHSKLRREPVKVELTKMEALENGEPHFEVIPYESNVKH